MSISSWFSYVFTYKGDNHGLQGFYNAIILVMETGFAVTAFIALFLNLILAEEIADEEVPELTANVVDEERDEQEWDRIKSKKTQEDARVGNSSSEDAVEMQNFTMDSKR